MLLEIELGIGVGPIKFGDTAFSVKGLLGTELYYEDWMGGNLENFLFYSGILIGFRGNATDCPADDSKVCSVVVRPMHELVLWGKSISGFNKAQIASMLKSRGLKFRNLSDTVTQCKIAEISFYFDESGLLEQVYIGQKNS